VAEDFGVVTDGFIEVAEGSGLDKTIDFNLFEFCSIFKFSSLQAFHGLKILQQAGYIELTEEINSGSRVLFTVTKEELYRLDGLTGELEELTKLLLRSYTGLFTEYAYIDELLLAKRMDATRDEVYQWLVALAKLNIISYIPLKKTPFIVFTRERVDERQLVISKEVYEHRRKRMEERIEKAIAYASEENRCRSRMLLHYFGEEQSDYCGCCDYCLSNKDKGLHNADFLRIRELILHLLKESPCSVFELLPQLDGEKEEYVIEVLRWMQDRNEILMNEEGHWKFGEGLK